MSDDLVKRLREVSLEKHQEAWARSDGGQDLTIGAMLADEAADRIQELEAKLAKAVEKFAALEKAASDVARRGAETGPQWTKLTIALLAARTTLAELKGQADE
jgi:hypothetical protein